MLIMPFIWSSIQQTLYAAMLNTVSDSKLVCSGNGDRPFSSQLAMEAAAEEEEEDTDFVEDGKPWWHRFPDFVPLSALEGGKNPRSDILLTILSIFLYGFCCHRRCEFCLVLHQDARPLCPCLPLKEAKILGQPFANKHPS